MTVRLRGVREIDKKLRAFTPRKRRTIGLRTLRKAAGPLADAMRDWVPVQSGQLMDAITVSPTLSRRAKAQRGSLGRETVSMFVGVKAEVHHAHFQEFGTAFHAPQPFMRPAWESQRGRMLARIRRDLRREIARLFARGV